MVEYLLIFDGRLPGGALAQYCMHKTGISFSLARILFAILVQHKFNRASIKFQGLFPLSAACGRARLKIEEIRFIWLARKPIEVLLHSLFIALKKCDIV